MGTVVALIAAFVFFAVAIMFVIRFVVLIFILILSPLAFMGFILPQLNKYKDQWLDALLGQAFFAPIYFMLTWIVIIVSRGLLINTGGDMATAFIGAVGSDGNTVTSPPLASIELLVNFIIMIVLLIASLTIAKQWADKAGHGVPGLTKWAMGAAGGATLGMVGRGGRNIIGSRAAAMADDENLKKRAAEGNIRARLQLAAASKAAKSSFDLRGTPLSGQLDAGKAKKGGFIQDQKDRAKAYEKYKPSKDATDKASEEEAKTQRELDQAAERAIPKSVPHIDAETRLKDLRRTSTAGFSTQQALAHKAKLDATREEIEQHDEELTEKKRVYITTAPELEGVRARHAENKENREKLGGRMESMAKRAERPIIKFGPIVISGTNISGKQKANAIRAASKGKSRAKRITELAIEEAKEQEREESGGSGATPTTPLAGSAPTTT